jgi:hypothetical protein
MKNFFTYDATGLILQTGSAPDEMIVLQASSGKFVLEGSADPKLQYVSGGALVNYTAAELSARAALAPGWAWKMPERIAVDMRSLDRQRAEKVSALSAACNTQIVVGFTSSALGAAHSYPANPLDQNNLSGSVLASILPGNAVDWTTPFWCADAAGAWSFAPHTTAQIQQVGRDSKAALLAALSKNDTLAKQVAAATDKAGIDAVIW